MPVGVKVDLHRGGAGIERERRLVVRPGPRRSQRRELDAAIGSDLPDAEPGVTARDGAGRDAEPVGAVEIDLVDLCPDATGVSPRFEANSPLDGAATQTRFVGNFWGGATPVEGTSFGSLKARYRGEVEPQGVKPGR